MPRPKLSARAKKRHAQVIAAQEQWQAEQDRRKLAELKAANRLREDTMVDKFLNDVLAIDLSDRVLFTASEINARGQVVGFVIPITQLRQIIKIVRSRIVGPISALPDRKQEGK